MMMHALLITGSRIKLTQRRWENFDMHQMIRVASSAGLLKRICFAYKVVPSFAFHHRNITLSVTRGTGPMIKFLVRKMYVKLFYTLTKLSNYLKGMSNNNYSLLHIYSYYVSILITRQRDDWENNKLTIERRYHPLCGIEKRTFKNIQVIFLRISNHYICKCSRIWICNVFKIHYFQIYIFDKIEDFGTVFF